jgi:zinc D-Ala-D-Ala dipeptidase
MPTISIEDVPQHHDFVALSTIADIVVDLRYATPNNFVGRDLYSQHDCAWLHVEAANALAKAAQWLRELPPATANVRLCVLDALRPQRVQEALWSTLADTDLKMYVANPAMGSLHSFGMAVDVTLVNRDGVELDMGTPFDDLTPRSHPANEAVLLAAGELTAVQVSNREMLRNALFHAGFQGISTEWWHFNFGDREKVRREYLRVL